MRVNEPVFMRLPWARERYELHEPYRILLPIVHRELFVCAGFQWDGGSLPRFLWRLSHPVEFAAAYCVHDALYRSKLLSRSMADKILFELIKTEGGSWLQRWLIYIGVRLFGWRAWGAKPHPWRTRRYRKLISLDSPPL